MAKLFQCEHANHQSRIQNERIAENWFEEEGQLNIGKYSVDSQGISVSAESTCLDNLMSRHHGQRKAVACGKDDLRNRQMTRITYYFPRISYSFAME